MVAGAGDIEEADVVIDPAGQPAESVAGGRAQPRPPTHSIINLNPEHYLLQLQAAYPNNIIKPNQNHIFLGLRAITVISIIRHLMPTCPPLTLG